MTHVSPGGAADSPQRSRAAIAYAVLALASLVPYLHTLHFGFINYDDPATIIELPLIRSLTWRTLPRFFVPDVYAHLPEYMPLKNLSYALDYALFGLHAPGYRMQQQLWFTAAVLMTFAWLRMLLARAAELGRLGACPPASSEPLAFSAVLLFAVHPVHVDSVTWLSGRKDVLCGFGMALTLWSALRIALTIERAERVPFAGVVVCLFGAAFALLSKPTALTLLLLLPLQDLWLGSMQRRALGAHIKARALYYGPIVLLSGAFFSVYQALTAAYLRGQTASDLYTGPLWLRLGQQLARYLQSSLAPIDLVPVYPAQAFQTDAWSMAGLLAGGVLIALIAALGWGLMHRHLLGFALGFFVCALAPSLLRPVWGQFAAPRYLFHAVLGPVLVVVWSLFALGQRAARVRRLVPWACSGIALTWLLVTTAYASVWRDSGTLWQYAVSVHPDWPTFYDLAARDALGRADLPAARELLTRCIEHSPSASICKGPLGGLTLLDDPVRGERLLREALLADNAGIAHLRLSQHLASTGRAREGFALYERYLSGRGAGPDEIAVMAELALAAGEPGKAERYAHQIVRAALTLHPASPPPAALIARLVSRLDKPELLERVQRAEADCARTDCFAAALGW
jgi:hypothetical protein